MPVPIQTSLAPYASNPDETNLDTVDTGTTEASVVLTIALSGTIAQIQADWATLAAVTLSAPSALLGWQEA